MINPIRNQKGIALVVTLMVLVLGFAIVAILFRLATQETKLTGLEQGYTSALDAAKAGTDLFIDMIETGLPNPPPPVSPYSGPPNPFGISTLGGQCLQIKMNTTPSSAWATPAWTTAGCPSVPNATSVFPPGANAASTALYYPDTTLTLSNYTVYIKVIDNWFTQATGASPCNNGCYYYTVLARAVAPNSSEYADVQFVYRYSHP